MTTRHWPRAGHFGNALAAAAATCIRVRASQTLRNLGGQEWQTWNEQIQKALLDSQVKEDGCAAGSWDPAKPTYDSWGQQGGRLLITSLSCLTLEVYYRYAPVYPATK
jgi:hypothetical protein